MHPFLKKNKSYLSEKCYKQPTSLTFLNYKHIGIFSFSILDLSRFLLKPICLCL